VIHRRNTRATKRAKHKHHIYVKNTKAFTTKRRIRNPVLRQHAHEKVKELFQNNLLRKAEGPSWSHAIVIARQNNGKLKFCIDYRPLNEATEADSYPIPRIDDLIAELNGSIYFSSIDLTNGYWQIELDEESKKFTGFSTDFGVFEWEVMPLGLKNAPATFQRFMDEVIDDFNLNLFWFTWTTSSYTLNLGRNTRNTFRNSSND